MKWSVCSRSNIFRVKWTWALIRNLTRFGKGLIIMSNPNERTRLNNNTLPSPIHTTAYLPQQSNNTVVHPLHGSARSNSDLKDLSPTAAASTVERLYQLVPVKSPHGQKGDGDGEDSSERIVKRAIDVSIAVNAVLAVAKLYAVIQSGSLAVLASLMDSALDLISQLVVAYTEQRARAAFDVR